MPKVSICVPAYGNPEGIGRLLSSVRQQSFQDYEVILTDDSPDESVRRAAEAAALPGLIYRKNPVRLGASANWNEAVRLAGGDYIKMMHHDDWFSGADSLERFVDMLEKNPGAVLAFSGTWQVTLPGREEEAAEGGKEPGGPHGESVRDQSERAAQKDGGDQQGRAARGAGSAQPERFARGISPEHEALIAADWRNLFLGNYIGSPSATIYRRNGEAYEGRLTWLMDMEYYMRLLEKQPHFACTREPLICIGVSQNQLTERCRTDGDLNLFEYGFLFEEFGLGDREEYRRKLISVALSYGRPYSALEKFGIPKEEYQAALQAKRREDFRCILGAARRKLGGRK